MGKAQERGRSRKRAERKARFEAWARDPANIMADGVWAHAPRAPCAFGPEGCDGDGYCDGHCRDPWKGPGLDG